ncbi:DUF2333 family protein [Photobacterium sp. GB-36]|uniref:DUF2333 family protein n=1 Tax=Photobacterium sp. GB-36 TaxID=2022108 RepID=UPI000D159BFB|nr:DUF2333 family protein [Photobacterium sp. GB-36]PSV45400.1 DUF2333 domain-containing protein [Photobacterium sp. GB-36]
MSKVKVIIGAVFFTVVLYFLSIYWSFEPDTFNPDSYAAEQAKLNQQTLTTGYETTTTLIHISELLINKQGGFLTNDKLPPSLLMDNMPAWETGVLTQVRDMALVLKDNLSRPQNESHVDSDLKEAQPALNINSHSWNFPSAESEYQNAIDALTRYRDRLSASRHPAQFYSRDDNLVAWLEVVQKRLGTISQDLGSSVGEPQLIMDSKTEGKEVSLNAPKTSWFKIDNVFYESRGSTWAILLLMKAMKHDFEPLLEEEKATVMINQIIRELEATQETIWSPMILNGMGFGLLPNHSLIMANYVSRAQAGTVDLINLLEKR